MYDMAPLGAPRFPNANKLTPLAMRVDLLAPLTRFLGGPEAGP